MVFVERYVSVPGVGSIRRSVGCRAISSTADRPRSMVEHADGTN